MKSKNNMFGMYVSLFVSLLVVPFIGLAVSHTSFDLGAKSIKNAVEASVEGYTNDLYDYTKDLKTTSTSTGRPETVQDILKDYREYLENNK